MQIYLITKNGKYLGIIESEKGIVTCNVPSSDKSSAWKVFQIASQKLKMDLDNLIIETTNPSQYSDVIFAMAEQPKVSWKKAKEIPIDYILYTPNQKKVVETLRSLNPGQIITYGELAELAGFPRASRFVGSTMAKNYVPLIVPCHRVVPASKKIGKYSGGGPEVKRRLLKFEGLNI